MGNLHVVARANMVIARATKLVHGSNHHHRPCSHERPSPSLEREEARSLQLGRVAPSLERLYLAPILFPLSTPNSSDLALSSFLTFTNSSSSSRVSSSNVNFFSLPLSNTMGETLAMAQKELEDLYLGVPDDSADLTFKDFASFQQNDVVEHKKGCMDSIHEESIVRLKESKGLEKIPSLDFAKALQEARTSPSNLKTVENSQVYSDVSDFIMLSPSEERQGKRRPGIPHSNICSLCSEYVYIFRNRCLVCGRVYCKKCVRTGMGEMTEGRKCVECLGIRFSQRYIQRVGDTGCCWKYKNVVKQQELKWAEKGPRRSGERQYGRQGGAVSRSLSSSRSPMPKSKIRSSGSENPPSFVASSMFSASPHVQP